MKNPSSSFEIMTPDGNISITPENGKALIDESLQFIKIDGVNFSANELLDQQITDMQRDLFDQSLIRLKTEEPQDPQSRVLISNIGYPLPKIMRKASDWNISFLGL